MRRSIGIVICLIVFVSCEKSFLPKPTGYNRIELPEHAYQVLEEGYAYRFAYSRSSEIAADSFNLAEKNWINLHYAPLGATVHLTYKQIRSLDDFRHLTSDAFQLTAKHQIKAYGIEESVLHTPRGYGGVAMELSGEVPTQFQFFVTDSTDHFLRGALYFNTAMKNDSLSPVIEYIKVDMAHLINTLVFED